MAGTRDSRSHRWAGDRGNAEHARQQTLDPRALDRRENVADDSVGHRLHAARAQTLDGAERDELRHAFGEAAQGGAQKEQGHTGEEHLAPPEHVRESAVKRDRHCLREHVGGENPGVLTVIAKAVGNHGHHGGDDRGLDRCHEGGGHAGGEDQGPPRDRLPGWA
jgi:hypothetical protein